MTDYDGPWFSQRFEQTDDVADEMEERVRIAGLRLFGLAVSAHVRSDGVESGVRQCGQLMPPRGVPGLGESMAHHDKRTIACLGNVDAKAVGLKEPIFDLHGSAPMAKCLRLAVVVPLLIDRLDDVAGYGKPVWG
jgi:hypothetical protein